MEGITLELTENELELLNDYTAATEDVEDTSKWSRGDVVQLVGRTDNLQEQQFEMLDGAAVLEFKEDEEGDRLLMKLARMPYGITTEAFLQIGKEVGLPKKFCEETPFNYEKVSQDEDGRVTTEKRDLLLEVVNYWLDNKGGEKKALIYDGRIVAFVRPGTKLYSTTELVNSAVNALSELGHEDVWFDKVHHTIEETQMVLVIDDFTTTLPNGDVLKGGFQIQHSVLAKKPLAITPIVYSEVAGIHAVSMSRNNYAQWNRKLDSNRDADDPFADDVLEPDAYDVYQWMEATIKDLYATIRREFMLVQGLLTRNIGAHSGTFFNDVCAKYKIPTPLRRYVLEEYGAQDGQSIYHLWRAIATTAGSDECADNVSQQRHMMSIAGEIAAHPESCPQCHRLTDGVELDDSDD
jgi:hypothetical protein